MKLKIPDNIVLFYNHKYIAVKSNYVIKFFKLKTKVNICNEKKKLIIPQKLINLTSKINIKSSILFNITLKVILNKIFKSLQYKRKQKLKIIGIGFRVSIDKFSKSFNILKFKLGYSHSINVIVANNIKILCTKKNKIMISGYNTQIVNNLSLLIRSFKLPELYKGKGILYENEKIKLKEVKKL